MPLFSLCHTFGLPCEYREKEKFKKKKKRTERTEKWKGSHLYYSYEIGTVWIFHSFSLLPVSNRSADRPGDVAQERLALAPTAASYGVEYIVCNNRMVSGENEIALKMWLQIV